LFKAAVDGGVTLFNTACFYGPLHSEGYGANLRLLGKCLAQPGIDRSKLQLMVKIGMDTRAPVDKPGSQWLLKATPEFLQQDVDFALAALGVDYIDIIVLCRMPPAEVSIEAATAAMAAIVASGKARHIGLSEASAAYIRHAHAVHPVHCIEQEWSLWSRDIEAEIVPTCRQLGVRIVAYSPLGRGFLTGTITSRADPAFGSGDWRLVGQPKFAEANFSSNLKLVEAAAAGVAARVGCSMGQLALAWLHAQGEDVYPIPGTTKLQHLASNLAAAHIQLSAADVAELNGIFKEELVAGDRYP
jgi:aryl-alcohol dehydrogenase-like predicted oxidoreductase